MRKRILSQSAASALGLLILLVLFYPSFFLVKAAPLTGDHWEQHYPWAMTLYRHLRHFTLPFWTSYIHSGFPIAAESQIGVYYLPNLILYGLLPFKWAYSYMNLIHFFLAGWGTYLYTRKIGLTAPAAFISATLFTFGASFGGAYYNMTSLKTISWFPLALFFLEAFLSSHRYRFLAAIAAVVGQSLVAGYLQVALFTWFFFACYAAARILIFHEDLKTNRWMLGLWIGIAFLAAALLAMPQIYLIFQLAQESSRVGLTEDYAYIGSLSPFSLMTLFDPAAQYAFRGNNLYMGLISLFFIIAAFLNRSSSRFVNFWIWMLILAFLLALGRWSPLYVAIVKLTGFYSFRVPAKFLGFICFSFSVLAGYGYQYLRAYQPSMGDFQLSKIRRIYFLSFALFMVTGGMFYIFLTLGQDTLYRMGEWYLSKFYHGKSGHPRSLEDYFLTLRSFRDVLLNLYSLNNFENLRSFFFIALSAVFAFHFRGDRIQKWLRLACIFLLVDLYSFSWIDVKKDFSFYSKAEPSSPIIDKLIELKRSGQLTRLYSFRKNGTSLPILPSSNMIYGIEELGCYSPLVSHRYFSSIGLLGNINNSTHAHSPEPAYLYDRLQLLSAMDVSHVLSNEALHHPSLNEVYAENSTYLYELLKPHSRFIYLSHGKIFADWEALRQTFMHPNFDPSGQILLEESELKRISQFKGFTANESFEYVVTKNTDHHSSYSIQVSKPGFFVRMESFDPGWKAIIDHSPSPVIKAFGLFQAVYISEPGDHNIEFIYRPYSRLLDEFKK